MTVNHSFTVEEGTKLASRSMLNIHIKSINLHLLPIWPIKRSWLSGINPLRRLRSKGTPEKVGKVLPLLLPRELISIRASTKRQDDLLAILALANWDIMIDTGARGLELIVGGVRTGSRIDGAAAFVAER